MTTPKNLGMLLVAIWFILYGALHFVTLSGVNVGAILAILAIVAGVLLLLQR
ncbi:MAG TPA: hypothetical protein VL371_23440 [Gemmataceae bacterium]|jgi:hypothetical protein|nr:hypothetical protein [Gemmataceae bacterium]